MNPNEIKEQLEYGTKKMHIVKKMRVNDPSLGLKESVKIIQGIEASILLAEYEEDTQMETEQDYANAVVKRLTVLQEKNITLYRFGKSDYQQILFHLNPLDNRPQSVINSSELYADVKDGIDGNWTMTKKTLIDDEVGRRKSFLSKYNQELRAVEDQFRNDYRESITPFITVKIPNVPAEPIRSFDDGFDRETYEKDCIFYESARIANRVAYEAINEMDTANFSAADIARYGFSEFEFVIDEMRVWYDKEAPRRLGWVNFIMKTESNIPGDRLQVEANSVVHAVKVQHDELLVHIDVRSDYLEDAIDRFHMTIHRGGETYLNGERVELEWSCEYDDKGASLGIYSPSFAIFPDSRRIKTLAGVQQRTEMARIMHNMILEWLKQEPITIERKQS